MDAFSNWNGMTLHQKKLFAVDVLMDILCLTQNPSQTRRLQLLCLLKYCRHHGYFAKCFDVCLNSFEEELVRLTKYPSLYLDDNQDLEILSRLRDFGPPELQSFLARMEKIHQDNIQLDEDITLTHHRLVCQEHPSWSQLQDFIHKKNLYMTRFMADNLVVTADWQTQKEKDAVFILNLLWKRGFFMERNMCTFIQRASASEFSAVITKKLQDLKHEFGQTEERKKDDYFPVIYDYHHVPSIPNEKFLTQLLYSMDIFFYSKDSNLQSMVLEDVIHILDNPPPAQLKKQTSMIASRLMAVGIPLDKRRYTQLIMQDDNSFERECDKLLSNPAMDMMKCHEQLYSNIEGHCSRVLVDAFFALCSQ